jgi:hypothetical protein
METKTKVPSLSSLFPPPPLPPHIFLHHISLFSLKRLPYLFVILPPSPCLLLVYLLPPLLTLPLLLPNPFSPPTQHTLLRDASLWRRGGGNRRYRLCCRLCFHLGERDMRRGKGYKEKRIKKWGEKK